MKNLVQPEYDDQTEREYKACIHRQLEWVRITNKRKPGWTYYAFMEAFGGSKPEKWMKDLAPEEPSKELLLWLNRRNTAFKREKKVERGARGNLFENAARTEETTEAAGGDGMVEE